MPSYGVQLQAAKTAHLTIQALEKAASDQIAQAFDDWESGKLNAQTVRHKLESIVRSGYRASAAIAVSNTQKMAELPGWKPASNVNSDDYLKSLIKDIQSNLRIYKASPKTDVDRRRAVFRMQLSAGVGTERGYTDGLIKSNTELADFGYAVKKIWMANFVDNVPCPLCAALHGTELPLDSDFNADKISAVKVYHNLAGPPRHPRCQCYVITLITTLENAFEKLDIDHPTPAPQTMNTDDVQSMPGTIFTAVVKALQKIMNFVKGT